MPKEESLRNEFVQASQSAQKKITETQKQLGDAMLQAHDELLKTIQEMGREVMSCGTAEAELGLKLSKKLSEARSIPDAMAAYQEWVNEEMNARSQDVSRLMTNSQKFINTSTRLFSNWPSGVST